MSFFYFLFLLCCCVLLTFFVILSCCPIEIVLPDGTVPRSVALFQRHSSSSSCSATLPPALPSSFTSFSATLPVLPSISCRRAVEEKAQKKAIREDHERRLLSASWSPGGKEQLMVEDTSPVPFPHQQTQTADVVGAPLVYARDFVADADELYGGGGGGEISHHQQQYEEEASERKPRPGPYSKTAKKGKLPPLKKFKCTDCDQQFSQKGGLSNHVRIHAGDKPFVCGMCAREFVQKCNLMRHLRIHTGEKLFACPQCGLRLNRKSQLDSHMARHATTTTQLLPLPSRRRRKQ